MVRADAPLVGFRLGLRVARRRVSHGERHRGLPIALISRTEARLDGQTVATDGDATQHQVLQGSHGHCRPPANK
jgi:hypothetical protein